VTELERLTSLADELRGNEDDLRDAFAKERAARTSVLENVWLTVQWVIPTLANRREEIGHPYGECYLLETTVYPERGGSRRLFLALDEDDPRPLFVLATGEETGADWLDVEVLDAAGVCEKGHRWRLGDLTDALEDLLLRAIDGKMKHREQEARDRAKVLNAISTLLAKVKA